jgi:alkylated DNA repair dioxygenase AlkB
MGTSQNIAWQPSLLAEEELSFDGAYSRLERIHLDSTSWIDLQREWLTGSDALFKEVLENRDWGQRVRRMYDKKLREPRLTAPWNARSGEALTPPILEDMRVSLSERYGVEFDSVGFNLYRDGNDSVAWHGDKIKKEVKDPIVVLVSLGAPRRFLLRPSVGGKSASYMLNGGDLLVTGGTTQRTWQHSVPKVKQAGPRISLAYRHGMDPNVYKSKEQVPPEEVDLGAAALADAPDPGDSVE